MSLYWLAVFPVLGLLVLVHEFGHFIAAKWAGIRVEEFGLGFPPAVVGIRKRDQGGWEVMWFGQSRDTDIVSSQNPLIATAGGISQSDIPPSNTIYSLNLLPIGGFVRMPGETGDVQNEDGLYDPQSFAAKSAGRRIVVLCAGVFMNVVLAVVLFTIAYGLQGEPTYPSVIDIVVANSPAQAAGLMHGDTVVSVNGHPVSTFDDMHAEVTKVIAADNGQHDTVFMTLEIRHKGQKATEKKIVNARAHPGQGQGALGVSSQMVPVSVPLWQAPLKGVVMTYNTTRTFLGAIGQMITGAIKPQLSGPVGIAQVTGQVAETVPTLGWWPILNLTALLSLNIAIINILPFPALDGGRIVIVLIEILRGGKRLKPEREGLINFVGLSFLLLLLVAVTVSDVIHWGG